MPTRDKHQTDAKNVDLDERKREFGTAAQVARAATGRTQAEVADKWGYTRAVVANLERGRFDRPAYKLAHDEYKKLPIIPEMEVQKRNDDSPEDPERDAIVEFELMLLDRTRERQTLLGSWFALWETEVNGQVVFNSELLEFAGMRSRRRLMITNPAASLENPLGGYAWRAECRFIDGNALLGVYASTDEENLAKGALQMRVHVQGRFMEGQWIGQGYDGDFARGHVVFCRDREQLVPRMQLLLGQPIDFTFHDTKQEGKN